MDTMRGAQDTSNYVLLGGQRTLEALISHLRHQQRSSAAQQWASDSLMCLIKHCAVANHGSDLPLPVITPESRHASSDICNAQPPP